MKTTHLMRLVAILLCAVLIFEDPMTALASSNAVTSDSVSADETNDIEASQESTDTPDTAAAGSYKNEGSVKPEAEIISENLVAESAQTGFEAAIDDIPADNDKAPVEKVAVKDKTKIHLFYRKMKMKQIPLPEHLFHMN